MHLKELLKTVDVVDIRNPQEDVLIKGIANHTDDIEESYLYVAIKGYISDGHEYIDKAIENGATAVVVEDFVSRDVLQIKVENSRKALAILSDNFFGHPSKDMRVIGVTATNGKTTTTYMLNEIFQKAQFKSGLIGSVITKIGDEFIQSDLTTPESVDLQRYLYGMKKEGIQKVAMEVSSSGLELYRTKNVEFDILAFNNFSREHIDQHGNYEKYWQIKSSLIRDADEKSYAVLNLDDDRVRSLVSETKAKVISYSLKEKKGNLYCKDLDLSSGRASFTVAVNIPFKSIEGDIIEDDFSISLGVPGYHSVANSMAAITIALIDGVSPEIIQSALKDFQGVERRFQYIYEDDFVIIDDHFANRGNINVTLETLKYMDYKNLHLVYAIRGNRGITVNKENAETVVAWKDKLGLDEIIASKSIGDVTSKDTVSPEELEVFMGVMEPSGIKVSIYDTLIEAIKHALANVKEGDIVLLAGCQGMDHGGKISLDILKEMRPNVPLEELYKPISNRVV